MKGDFTRDTFDRKKHYSSVLMQQGRVQLDADWNEQGEIQDYRDRVTHIDVIGNCGGPMGKDSDGNDLAGFKLTGTGSNLTIHKGRYYVDGILVENEADILLDNQPDLPGFDLKTIKTGTYLVYLDVWERHITALEDPEVREVALGGPDTATRKKVIWQVKLFDAKDMKRPVTCESFGKGWAPQDLVSTGKLAARAEPDPDSDDPCIVPAEAGYRRLENQLYRVEIHKSGGLNNATFKWSRENGSVIAKWKKKDGTKLVVNTAGRDEVLRFSNGDWIEITDDSRELSGRPGLLAKLLKVEGLTLTYDPNSVHNAENPADKTFDLADFPLNPKIRRWESDGAEEVKIPAVNNGWLKLEDGVEVKFETGGVYQTGDYWLIPARTIEGNVLWPKEGPACDPVFSFAHGIEHHYCKLAVAVFDGKTWDIEDCRNLFPPLTEIEVESCCQASVGDGVHSTGKFSEIQEAIDSLGEKGGTVCILPGIYRLSEPVIIRRRNIRIEGCNKRAYIQGPDNEPAFVIKDSLKIDLDGLVVKASSEKGAVFVVHSKAVNIVNCDIVNRRYKDEEENKKNLEENPETLNDEKMFKRLEIRERTKNEEGMAYRQKARSSGPAILAMGAIEFRVSKNFLHGYGTVWGVMRDATISDNHATGGGYWIMDGSRLVSIEHNRIFDGLTAGIILGGMVGDEASQPGAGVQWVDILDNRIFQMAGSGITSIAESEDGFFGDIEEVTIARNQILHCVNKAPDPVFNARAAGGVVLENASALRIHGNIIVENGSRRKIPAVGIFVDTAFGVNIHDNTIMDNGISDSEEKHYTADFSQMDKGARLDNPYNASDHIRLTAYNMRGSQVSSIHIGGTDFITGIQCTAENIFEVAEPVDRVVLRMLNVSEETTSVKALNAAGDVVDVKNMEQPPGTIESVVLNGEGIVKIVVSTNNKGTYLASATFMDLPESYQGGIIGLFVLSTDMDADETRKSFELGGPALQAINNTVITPAGQAILLVGVGPMLVNGNTLTTRGTWVQPIKDEGETGDTGLLAMTALQVGKCVSIINLGQAIELYGLAAFSGMLSRVDGGGYTAEAYENTDDGFNRFAVPTAMMQQKMLDGRVQCNDNQITFENMGAEINFNDIAFSVSSYDDISVQDNQISAITKPFKFISSGIVGATVRVNNNRFTEIPMTTLASCMSLGLLANTMIGNTATHCLFILPLTMNNNIVKEHNLIINPVLCNVLKG